MTVDTCSQLDTGSTNYINAHDTMRDGVQDGRSLRGGVMVKEPEGQSMGSRSLFIVQKRTFGLAELDRVRPG